MPKKENGEAIISESGNWNVADQYTKSKIMRPLNLCDYYEDIAMFGYESIAEELVNWQAPPNDLIRVKAMKRLIRELIRLIDNCKFALKAHGTKEKVLQYKQELIKIDGIVPKLVKVNRNNSNGNSIVKIVDFTNFENVLNTIGKIKSKINEPLNKNHLIFTDKEEFDPKAFKKGLKDRMINQG